MKWPWEFKGEVRAMSDKADAQREDARQAYESTVKKGNMVMEVFAAVRFHSDKNAVTDSIQKVARGHG